jgi:adenylyltransferase/sulfurtransferase
VSVFNDKGHEGTASVNYRDLFPDPPQEGEVLNCADTGVLGVLPGVVGTLQANEAIKLITGIGTPLAGKILNINLLSNQFVEIGLTARPQTRALIPADRSAFEKINYEWLCGSIGRVNEINPDEFDAYINSGDALIVDVRENGELPFIQAFKHIQIPLSDFKNQMQGIQAEEVIFFCQAGSRSKQAAALYNAYKNGNTKSYSLAGGILSWEAKHKMMNHG